MNFCRVKTEKESKIDLIRGKFIASCAGNVESALTLIPTVILFLSVLQLGSIALSRVVYAGVSDGRATQKTFLGVDSASTSHTTEIPLSGGGSLYVVRDSHSLPSFSPLLQQGDNFTSVGMSVQ